MTAPSWSSAGSMPESPFLLEVEACRFSLRLGTFDSESFQLAFEIKIPFGTLEKTVEKQKSVSKSKS